MAKRILLADDDDNLHRVMTTAIDRAGYEVRGAKDGVAALRLAKESQFDLAILDLIMPEKEGLETMEELRKLKNPPKILVISGGGRLGPQENLRMARMLGADQVLAKPFDLNTFVNLIKQMLA